jgi:hypothetical protein
MQERANQDENFLPSICFTDECIFTLNNEPNIQNTRYLSEENARINLTTRAQYPQKINFQAVICDNQIIGQLEIVGTHLNSQTYLHILINGVGPAIEEIAHEDQEVWFQQDSCPAHYGINVKTHLNQVFPNRWIGRDGTCTINYSGTRNIVFLWTLVDNFFYNFGVTFITNLKRVINLL